MSDSKYMSVGEARELLGVSEPKIAQMIKDHEIPWEINPLDKRSKLLDRAFVEALAAKVQRPKDLPDAA